MVRNVMPMDIYITGRIDDVINTAGHRLSTAEIESALVMHRDIGSATIRL